MNIGEQQRLPRQSSTLCQGSPICAQLWCIAVSYTFGSSSAWHRLRRPGRKCACHDEAGAGVSSKKHSTSHPEAGGGRNWGAELEAVVTARLLPVVSALLADDPPLPLFTLKLLAALLDARPAWAVSLARCRTQLGGYSCVWQQLSTRLTDVSVSDRQHGVPDLQMPHVAPRETALQHAFAVTLC